MIVILISNQLEMNWWMFWQAFAECVWGENNFFWINMQTIINIYSGEHSRLQTNIQKKTNGDKNKKALDWVFQSVAG